MGCRVGFGNLADGRPLWVAGSGNTDTLFYTPYDGNWWLGVHDGQALAWSNVGNTLGAFGDIWDGRPFWVGDFDADGQAEVLFYKSEAETTVIAGNPFASPRFRAPVPEMERIFRGGWKWL